MKCKRLSFLVLVILAALVSNATRLTADTAGQDGGPITPRELVAPNALMGPVPSSFSWSPHGALLAFVEPQDGQDMLWLYDAETGQKQLLLDPADAPDATIDVTTALWSPSGDAILLDGAETLWLLDPETRALKALVKTQGAKTGIEFSPDGAQVAYVQDNDLYAVRVKTGQIRRLTLDGTADIFNGALDWVYNEELATRAAQPAYAWSPDGRWLMYLRLDDTAVEKDPVTDYRPVPATVSDTRYPTAGAANPVASLQAVAAQGSRRAQVIPLPDDAEYVLPLFTWTPDGREAIYMTVNRDHTVLELRGWNATTGASRTIIRETDPAWINEDRYAPPIFLGDGSEFLWLSERDGFMHLYLYARDGTLVRQLTQGDWMIDSNAWDLLTPGRPVHVDPSGTWAYFISTVNSPLERQIYRVRIADGRLQQISQPPGFHFQALSGDGKYLVDQFTDVDTPPVTGIVKSDGSSGQQLAAAAGPALDLPKVTREFVTVKAHDGVDLYAQIVKPEGFDPSRKYPVVVHWYGGPGLQMVSNRYGATNIFNIIERDTLYTQEGFIVWRLDNRGSFGRGHAFETPIFGELGKAALDDQLAGIEYLKTLPYVDATRIGTDGKSFGGYMTLYALLNAPDVFRCGVAGAAPTDWSYYDTIYTERYMRTPQANPAGYAATSLVEKAAQIRARPLLVHGLDDTNVHLQNSVNFIQALEANDKPFDFIPLPNTSHSIHGDALATMLAASQDYFARCLEEQPVAAVEVTSTPGPWQGQAATPTRTAEVARVPLKDALGTLEPQAVWQNFYDLTQVPRPSHHEEQVRDFLVQFGKGLGLETIVDGAGNVLIRKPAAEGMENREGVVLQAHMDMVAQPQDGTHDFLTAPIDAYLEGAWVAADGTTLGADDGIGMAVAMAVLQSQAPPLGPIEALFTVNEEDGMEGALGLQPGLLHGTTLINLDGETDGTFYISSAGGEYARIKAPYETVDAPTGVQAYQVTVSGLQGGHSGVDINLGRGHATKLLVRLLSVAAPQYGVRLAGIAGGTAANAIPQSATALVTVPVAQENAFLQYVEEYQGILRAELVATEPDLAVAATTADLPEKVFSEDAQRMMLDALYGTPQGVLRMSDAVPGLVETSTNIGIVQTTDGELVVTCYLRSSVDSELDDVAQMIASVWDLAGVSVTFDGRYPGWKPNPDSPILALMQSVYHHLYAKDADVTSVHAGLECGVIQAAYPGMDAISIGPTLQDVHTTKERLEIATVQKLNDLLLETLKRMPEKAPQPAPSPESTAAPTAAPAATLQPPSTATPTAPITSTQVITYAPGPPTGVPQKGRCWTSSLAVWRADAWRCLVGNEIHDPCFLTSHGDVICGANPTTPAESFLLTLTEPLPAPMVPPDTSGHAWLVELADGTVCGYATGATGGVDNERINYFCPNSDPSQSVVILGNLQPGAVWTARRAVITGGMPNLTALESAQVPLRTVWR